MKQLVDHFIREDSLMLNSIMITRGLVDSSKKHMLYFPSKSWVNIYTYIYIHIYKMDIAGGVLATLQLDVS
jgi:hypothetical protein